ncbi:uncharacterized protein WCC33_009416 [Rhinophrynus dorsalis]
MSSSHIKLSGVQRLEVTQGLLGTLALMISVFTPHWYNSKGLWESVQPGSINQTTAMVTGQVSTRTIREAQLFFIGLSSVMAAASFCLCLVFMSCWRSPRHTKNAPQTPWSGSLLLAVLLPTGMFFFLGWIVFTWERWEDIQRRRISLGYSYWLGASAWTILLVSLPVTYVLDECTSRKDQKPVLV